MKLEQLIVQYLYSNKKVTLQDIGTFILSANVVVPAENEKETILPEGAIEYEFNSKAEKDEGLIDFIVQQSRKIKPLATSDLESYSLLSKQFLNIGKPMIIEGVGTLQKTQQGTYEFLQGQTINPKMENLTVTIKEKAQDEISFSSPAKKPAKNKAAMLIVVVLFLLSTAGALYYFLVYNKNNDIPAQQMQTVTPVEDTLDNSTDTASLLQTDSVNQSLNQSTALPKSDGYSFKIVLKEYPSRDAADKAFARLTTYGHKLLVSQKDAATFKLSMPFTNPVSDTARAKDSLRRFFGGKPYVDL